MVRPGRGCTAPVISCAGTRTGNWSTAAGPTGRSRSAVSESNWARSTPRSPRSTASRPRSPNRRPRPDPPHRRPRTFVPCLSGTSPEPPTPPRSVNGSTHCCPRTWCRRRSCISMPCRSPRRARSTARSCPYRCCVRGPTRPPAHRPRSVWRRRSPHVRGPSAPAVTTTSSPSAGIRWPRPGWWPNSATSSESISRCAGCSSRPRSRPSPAVSTTRVQWRRTARRWRMPPGAPVGYPCCGTTLLTATSCRSRRSRSGCGSSTGSIPSRRSSISRSHCGCAGPWTWPRSRTHSSTSSTGTRRCARYIRTARRGRSSRYCRSIGSPI